MRLICPGRPCQADNDVYAETCAQCGLPLHGYIRLSIYPSLLFNRGLSAVREGQHRRARDLFAALVYWCPFDLEARNALAMACYALGDVAEARNQWETVLARVPTDTLATRGLAALTGSAKSREMSDNTQSAKPRSRQRGHSKKKT